MFLSKVMCVFLKKHTHSRIPCPFSLFFSFSVTPRVPKCPKIIMRSATSSSSFFMPSFSFLLLFLANISVALFLHKRRLYVKKRFRSSSHSFASERGFAEFGTEISNNGCLKNKYYENKAHSVPKSV